LSADGDYTAVREVKDFSTHWTQVVALRNRALFLYDASIGLGWVSSLTASGQYKSARAIEGLHAGWTNIVAVGADVLFFYDSVEGIGQTARLTVSFRQACVS
jgi:hypothetical protein